MNVFSTLKKMFWSRNLSLSWQNRKEKFDLMKQLIDSSWAQENSNM